MFPNLLSDWKKLNISRSLLKNTIVFFLLLSITSNSLITRQITNNFLTFPELKYYVTNEEKDASSSITEVIVSNVGYGNATNVFLTAVAKQGSIEEKTVESQELYEEKDIKPLGIWLERLAVGAEVKIKLSGSSDLDLEVSVTSDQGVAEKSKTSSAPQVDVYRDGLIGMFQKSINILARALPFLETEDLSTDLSIPSSGFLNSDSMTVLSSLALFYAILAVFSPKILWAVMPLLNAWVVAALINVHFPFAIISIPVATVVFLTIVVIFSLNIAGKNQPLLIFNNPWLIFWMIFAVSLNIAAILSFRASLDWFLIPICLIWSRSIGKWIASLGTNQKEDATIKSREPTEEILERLSSNVSELKYKSNEISRQLNWIQDKLSSVGR